MIQIAFQPAYDAFHTVFRYFQIRDLTSKKIEIDRYRIIDFYLCFPDQLEHFRFAKKDVRFKRIAREFAEARRFEQSPSNRIVLARMKPIQFAALETLSDKGFLDADALEGMRVSTTDLEAPQALKRRLDSRRDIYSGLYEALSALLNDYDLLGPNGLKARADLLEHRYDAV